MNEDCGREDFSGVVVGDSDESAVLNLVEVCVFVLGELDTGEVEEVFGDIKAVDLLGDFGCGA